MKKSIFLVMLSLLMAVVVPSAFATTQLMLSAGATTIVITDNCTVIGPGCTIADPNLAPGQITYSGPVGANFTLNVTTGTNGQLVGVPPLMDLNSVDTCTTGCTTAAPKSLTIEFTADGFTGGAPAGFVSDIGGTLHDHQTLTYQAWYGVGLFDKAHPIGAAMSFSPVGFSGSTSSSAAVTSPYSVTLETVLKASAGGTTSYDASVDPTVPEPASVALLGGALLVAFGAMRRKLHKV